MDSRTETALTKVLFASMAVVLVFIVLQNIMDPWRVIFLSGMLFLTVTVRNILFYSFDRYYQLGRLTFFIDIAIVFMIGRFDRSGSSQIFYLVIIGDASIAYSYLFSSGITALCFLAYAAGSFIHLGMPALLGFIPGIAFHSLAFIATLAVMNIVKYQILQREKLSRTMYELKVKTKQLEDTYAKLKETSEELEDITILKERNRIAREIHDIVGHTLTTVLIELEAGERLIRRDPRLAAEKIGLAKGQVRKGLADIRESVGMLKTGKEIIGFIPSLKLLIYETTRHGDVHIRYEISEMPELTGQQQKALYRALQEGLTNGIKHGKSTAFVFRLKYECGCIRFLLQDNGAGSDKLVFGFGLTAMEQRIKEVKGIFNISSAYGEGCCINISIPADKEAINGPDKDSDCR